MLPTKCQMVSPSFLVTKLLNITSASRNCHPFRYFTSTILKNAQFCASAEDALRKIPDDARLMMGGFGLCGVPENSIRTLVKLGPRRLTVISNSAGFEDKGIGQLLQAGQLKRVIGSYVGDNRELQNKYINGQVEIEFVPQGTLAERIRARAAGVPAFYTPTGSGTLIQTGGAPIRYNPKVAGQAITVSKAKEARTFGGQTFILEEALQADFALIRGWKADKQGNVVFRKAANNFNEPMCKAADRSIVEVEEIVEDGQLEPDLIRVSSIYVHSFYKGERFEKPIERVRIQEDVSADKTKSADPTTWNEDDSSRIRIAKRAALELTSGVTVNLGIGIPVLVSNYIPIHVQVNFHSENGLLGMGPYPRILEEVDADLINASKETVTVLPGGAYFGSADSFALIRGGHLDVTMLGAMQVSQYGDLANWMIPGKLIKGMGGAMDLVSSHVSGTRVIVTTEHNSKSGEPKIVAECDLPLTGSRCTDMIITDKAVFKVHPQEGLTLLELAPDQTLQTITEATGAPFKVSPDLREMQQVSI